MPFGFQFARMCLAVFWSLFDMFILAYMLQCDYI